MLRLQNYINGQLMPPLAGRYLDNVDPATGQVNNRGAIDNEIAFLDEISHQVEVEVRQQLDSMLALEEALRRAGAI